MIAVSGDIIKNLLLCLVVEELIIGQSLAIVTGRSANTVVLCF